MKVAIYGQFYDKNSGAYIQDLLRALKENRIEAVVEEQFLHLIKENEKISQEFTGLSTFTQLDNSFDLFFSIGGDGTILRSVTYIRDLDIPIVGINAGRLGFLATVQKDEIDATIACILNREYTLSRRSLLSFDTSDEIPMDINFALNEIAVSRKNTTAMITIEVWLNGEYLNAYWADGLIVATPTGSTGYSLSCGGPVMAPDVQNFVITPIAPHNLNARPLVINDTTEIKLKISGREDSYLLSMDSRTATLKSERTITLKKAPFKINLAQLNNDSFIKTIRKKLLWGEDKRNLQQ
ncbi:NAD kinase [Gangjinia marincola]|uniref:NAD kinase n=1 Tax=Gangjinia marincola TaxID=578463 RepID=A0ABP3XSW0_9FLAO